MNYAEAKAAVFATGTVPDGYSGATASVGFALMENEIICVADHGYFRAPGPLVADESEALAALKNHPTLKAWIINLN